MELALRVRLLELLDARLQPEQELGAVLGDAGVAEHVALHEVTDEDVAGLRVPVELEEEVVERFAERDPGVAVDLEVV